jgi:hypothetical protein
LGGNPFQNSILGAVAENSQNVIRISTSFIRLEIFRDFIQFFGLYLAAIVPDLDKVMIFLLRDLPNFINLQLAKIFGHGTIVLIVMSLICLIALIVFFTSRKKDPNAAKQAS